MSVPVLSMACMAVGMAFAFAAPMVLLFYYKKRGAQVAPFFVGCGVFVVFGVLWANGQSPLPIGLLLLIVGVPVIVIICIVTVLIQRIKEIKGGEEDEAAQY